MTEDGTMAEDMWLMQNKDLKTSWSGLLWYFQTCACSTHFDNFSCHVAAFQSRSCRLGHLSCWCRSAHIHHCPLHTNLILNDISKECHMSSFFDWFRRNQTKQVATAVQPGPATYPVFGWVQQSVFDLPVGCFLSTSDSGVDSSV